MFRTLRVLRVLRVSSKPVARLLRALRASSKPVRARRPQMTSKRLVGDIWDAG
jgi:hypothetical protein